MSKHKSRGARLTDLFHALCTSAAASGEDRATQLAHGARLAVRVQAGRITVSIARPRVPVGQVEERTFRVNCQFPCDAERIPAEGQRELAAQDGTTWYQVAYRWRMP